VPRKAEKIKEIAKLMKNLDFCMFTTRSLEGGTTGRPMSNNGEVEFDGDVWFFSDAESRKVREIEADPSVQLSFLDPKGFRFIALNGQAKMVKNKTKKKELWMNDLERWFPDGPESPEVVLIRVQPTTVEYWTKNGDGKIEL
jgi:general stress protein 26